jgi:phosphoglycolate phosphatase
MYRAVLFDFDGTLADSYDAITASVNHVRRHHGLTELDANTVRELVGFGLEQLMADIVPEGDPHENAKIYRAHHPSVMFTHTRLLPGVRELLQALNDQGVKLGVCSNKPSAITRQLVEALGLSSLFDAVLGPEDSGEPKPSPKMLHLAMTKLGVHALGTLYIGDMVVDIQTARNANLPVWVVPTGSHSRETLEAAKPDRLLSSMRDVLALLNIPQGS